MRWLPLTIVAAALLTISTRAEETLKTTASVWQKLFRQQAADYRFTFADDEQRAVKLAPEPVLYWSQPVRGGNEGAVFLWTSAGRPVAMGTFFIWPPAEGGQAITHELHTLTPQAFTADWNNRPWRAPAEAVKSAPLAGTAAPAGTPERRLTQFKELARSFTAVSRGKDDRETELRLLPRPLYRYQLPRDDKSELIDGVVFGLVQGTDLEIVLQLEAVHEPSGPGWRWSAARMSDLPLTLKLDDKEVWQVEQARFDESQAAYFCGTVERYKEPPK
jgi:hypothetical protein